jgi:ribosomal-protein-serine acetyltransferase
LVVRCWVREDAAQLGEAVADSVEHLRPWMAWVAREPLSVTERQAVLDGWHQEWLAGGDAVMGVFVDGAVAGLCGLYRRIGPGGLEIGYWTARRFLRQGNATTAAGLLMDAAFSDPAITRVEIHHDQANQASVGVPRKLGMRLARKGLTEFRRPASRASRWSGRSRGSSGARGAQAKSGSDAIPTATATKRKRRGSWRQVRFAVLFAARSRRSIA